MWLLQVISLVAVVECFIQPPVVELKEFTTSKQSRFTTKRYDNNLLAKKVTSIDKKQFNRSNVMNESSRDNEERKTDVFNREGAKIEQIGVYLAGAVIAMAFAARSFGYTELTAATLEKGRYVLHFSNPTELVESVVSWIHSKGSMGYLYFGLIYTVAEIFAVPALPLTASSGYLFGLVGGSSIVLLSASIAAATSFFLGRTFFRNRIEKILENNPKFQAIDKAIGKDGFRIIFLLRLSPIFPFAISNYFYGITSVTFWEYVTASMLGFIPGTIAYVYGGGQVASIMEGPGLPWYVLAGGFFSTLYALKIIGDVANKLMEDIEPSLKERK